MSSRFLHDAADPMFRAAGPEGPGASSKARPEEQPSASELAGISRESETTEATIARLAVETFCDWALVDIVDDAGVQRRVAVEHADPSQAELAADVRRYPPNPAVAPQNSETIRSGHSLLAAVVSERDLDTRARDPRQAELARRIGMASYIVSPLLVRGRVLGTLSFMRVNRKRPFSPTDVPRAEEFARQAALAIDNARLAAEARRTAERISRLQNITAALSEALSPERVADAVLEQAMASLDASMGGIWLVAPGGRAAELLRQRNFGDLPPQYQRLSIDSSAPLAAALRTSEAVWIESRASYAERFPDSRAVELMSEEQAIACLPLVAERRVIGGLTLTFPNARGIDLAERAYLLAIARQCAQALERARLYEQERLARAEAEAANRLLQAIVNAAPLAITVLDADSTVRMWNPAAERIVGYSASEVLGKALPASDARIGEDISRHIRQTLEGRPMVGDEVTRHRKGGAPFAAEIWTARLEATPGRPQCLAILADVSERKRQEEWQHFLAQASEVLTSSLDYERTLEALVRLAVPTLGAIAAVDGPEFNAAAPLAVAAVDPAKAELAYEIRRRYPQRETDNIPTVLRSRKARISVHPSPEVLRQRAVDEEHARMMDGFGMRSWMSVPLVARGQTLGLFTFGAPDRVYEPRDLAMAEELARRAAIAIDNARLYRESLDAVRLREEFLTTAGHELRAPLTAMHLNLLAAIRLAHKGEPAEHFAARAERAARNMDRLIALANQMLDTSWLSGRALTLARSEFDLVEEVGTVVGGLEGALARAGCLVEVQATDAVRGRWDRARLAQLTGSLLSNAMKFGAGKPIHIRVEQEGPRAVLTVRDEGIGISPERLALLFQRFERAGAPGHYGGLGLGLWIAKQIVDAHGGALRVESAPEKGATFRVELPLGPPDGTA